MATIFIDGQAGTTGIEITTRLRGRSDLELLTIADEHRKDPAIREQMFKQADIAILCLPDAAALEACALAEHNRRILDASSAHRVPRVGLWTARAKPAKSHCHCRGR